MGYKVREYVSASGQCPYRTWLDALDEVVRARIQARILRFEQGNLGDCKRVSNGLYEARFMFGSGYRVYFGMRKGELLLLLCGGDKRTQRRDIHRALAYWTDYLKHGAS